MLQKQIRDGLYLKLLEEPDAPAVFAAVDRERVRLRKWLPWVDATTTMDHTREFIRMSLGQFAAAEGLAAGIWCGSEFAGTVGAHRIDRPNRKVEIGYWIAAKFQRQGMIASACGVLLEHLFANWRLNRVEIHCATGNQSSCKLAERLGFRLEGVLREAQIIGERRLDMNMYALLASEWKSNPA